MRSEVEQAFQEGGEAYGPPAPALTVDQIVKRSTDPEPGLNLQQMIIKNRDDALARLRAGQDAIKQRRAQQQHRDQQAKWLAFGQAMLSPTQTGGFGENVGMAAGAMRGEIEAQRGHEGERIAEEQAYAAQEEQIRRDYLDDELRRAQIEKQGRLGEYAQRRPVGTAYSMEHPENPNRFARVQQIWDPDVIGPNGEQGMMTTQYVDTPGEDGSIPYSSSPYDLQRRSELQFQLGLEEAKADRINNDIMAGREAYPVIHKYETVIGLMKEVERAGYGTGGWVDLLQRASEWFGVNTKEVTTLGILRNELGQAVLLGLKNFPGQISEGERKYMEALETGLSKPLGVNMALIEEGLRIQRQRYRRGVRAAREYGLNLDLEAMGITADTPEGALQKREAAKSAAPGSSMQNPIVVGPGVPEPNVNDWVRRPDGKIYQYKGRQ
jgi:hypothetical protein